MEGAECHQTELSFPVQKKKRATNAFPSKTAGDCFGVVWLLENRLSVQKPVDDKPKTHLLVLNKTSK